MTLIDHLGELRSRIVKAAIAFVLAATVAWFFRAQLFHLLIEPAGGLIEGDQLFVTSVAERFLSDMKMALWAAFVVTIPIILYQAWAFVAPAVGDMGRMFTYILITLASSLFLAGIAFGYFFVLPTGLKFLLSFGGERYENIITPSYYMAFTTRFLLACGLVFELPAATYVCAKMGLIDANMLKKYRKHAIVANTILAAAITPSPDPFSMIMLALPLLVMYELSIVIARYVNPTTEVQAHELARDDGPSEGGDEKAEERDRDEPDSEKTDPLDDRGDRDDGEKERDL